MKTVCNNELSKMTIECVFKYVLTIIKYFPFKSTRLTILPFASKVQVLIFSTQFFVDGFETQKTNLNTLI